MKAQTDAIQSSCIKCREYTMSLFHRAKCISENELNKQDYIIQAWQDMADASKMFITLYADILQPKVNAYEENPFCYLITAYASMCHEYLRFLDLHNALICLEKATDTAIQLYTWASNHHVDSTDVMEDVVFFVKHTPDWCCNRISKELALSLTTHSQFKECKDRLEDILSYR